MMHAHRKYAATLQCSDTNSAAGYLEPAFLSTTNSGFHDGTSPIPHPANTSSHVHHQIMPRAQHCLSEQVCGLSPRQIFFHSSAWLQRGEAPPCQHILLFCLLAQYSICLPSHGPGLTCTLGLQFARQKCEKSSNEKVTTMAGIMGVLGILIYVRALSSLPSEMCSHC